MTDFLATLAARTLGLAPVIQPMISSIFSSGLVVFDDYGLGEMGGEREYKALDQFSSPDLPAISRLPLSQISTPASEFNNIEFNDEMGKMPRQQNIEPVVESGNTSINQSSESLPIQRFSEVEVKGSYSGGFATSEIHNMPSTQGNDYETWPTFEQQELPIKSSQSNPDIPKAILPFATRPQHTEKSESQSRSFPTSNQLTQPSSAKTILSLTQFEPLVNRVQPDEIPVEIFNELENISAITKSTIDKENQQNINKSILPLSSSQTITPRLIEPLVNLGVTQKFPEALIYKTAIGASPSRRVAPSTPRNKSFREFFRQSSNQVEIDEIPVQISNEIENISLFSKAAFNQENQQNINKSILPLSSSQTITPRLIEPLVNLGVTQKFPETLIDITAIGASPSRRVAPRTLRNKSFREFLHKSSNQGKIDEIPVEGRGEESFIETLIDSAIPVSSSNEVGKLDKETKAKGMDNSKVKFSSSLSFPVSKYSENVSTFQPSQGFNNGNIVVVKPLVDRRMNASVQEEETILKSASLSEYLSQYAAAKNQPVVLPQQLSVYSEFHTQMESRKSGQTNRHREAVIMEQAPTKTIQVTIGRIEVRCNQTASQTNHTKPNRSEPKLSLQDYLKKRQGGNS
jgi:hypothetical protein